MSSLEYLELNKAIKTNKNSSRYDKTFLKKIKPLLALFHQPLMPIAKWSFFKSSRIWQRNPFHQKLLWMLEVKDVWGWGWHHVVGYKIHLFL